MSAIQRLSSQVIDYAERAALMADAAEGKGRNRGRLTRWLVLPASGAALYALVRSDSFTRQAKEVVDEAKTRATELPDDLVARVRQTNARTSSGNGAASPRKSTRSRRPASRRAGSTRKTTSSR
jgi:hypothetical protein